MTCIHRLNRRQAVTGVYRYQSSTWFSTCRNHPWRDMYLHKLIIHKWCHSPLVPIIHKRWQVSTFTNHPNHLYVCAGANYSCTLIVVNIYQSFNGYMCLQVHVKIILNNGMCINTPDIQKHGTMRNTKNNAKLIGDNTKGRLIWFLFKSKCSHLSTANGYTHIEHYFEDRCTTFKILSSYT